LRGSAWPAALLFAALGLGLAFAPRRVWGPSLLTVASVAIAVSFAPVPDSWLETGLLGCWMSVAATAATVHLRRVLRLSEALVLSFNAAIWSGGVTALGDSHLELFKALPYVFVHWPAAWIVRSGAAVAVKVVSSWLIAVAVLVGTLQLLPVTPGYLPDHIE
jgi:hypothetical protein